MLTLIIIIAAIVALLIFLGVVFRRGLYRNRVNPVHNDATSRYAANEQVQPGYDPDGLVDSPDEYGPRGRRAPFFGRRHINSR